MLGQVHCFSIAQGSTRTQHAKHETNCSSAAQETQTRKAARTLASQKPKMFATALGMSQERVEALYQDTRRASEMNKLNTWKRCYRNNNL